MKYILCKQNKQNSHNILQMVYIFLYKLSRDDIIILLFLHRDEKEILRDYTILFALAICINEINILYGDLQFILMAFVIYILWK